MATDAQDSRRRVRQSSSSEEIERSSKRHKHRHHHRRGRRRHASKRDEESKRDAETVDTTHSSNPGPDIFPNNNQPVDDVEEGEILEEDCFPGRGGEIGKKQTESDAESGEIQVTGGREVRSDKANVGLFTRETSLRDESRRIQINGKDSENNGEDTNKYVTSPDTDREDVTWHQSCRIHKYDGSPKRSSAISEDGKDAIASSDGRGNGYLDPKASKVDGRQCGELEFLNRNEKLIGNYDEEDLEINEGKVSIHRNSSSESAGEKYKTSRHSSHNKYMSRSRSRGHTRDRSRSRSIVGEHTHSRGRHSREHDALSYDGRNKTEIDIDEKRRVECDVEHQHGARDIVVDETREHHSSKCTEKENRHPSRGTNDRERSKERRNVDMDLRREKSWNREIDRVSGRKKERERSHERERREIEKDRARGRRVDWDKRRERERDRSSDDMIERDRRREKERDRTRDRPRGGDKDRDRDSERDDKHQDRDRIRERERQDDRHRCKDRDAMTGNDRHLKHEDGHVSRDRSRHSRHSRHEETEYHLEKKKTSGPQGDCTFMANSSEGGEDKLERGDNEQDDLDEKVTLQLAEQEEEEDLNRIKEESRRRREAILQKYKKQQQQVGQTPENEEKDKEPVDIPAATSEVHDGKNDDLDVDDAETLFAVGKSPPKNGNVASEKISGAGGLGEGTPKSERSNDKSDDKYCDDIFGETPTGVRILGKGDSLQVERGGQHDNWDDAEGYYSYRFGEILDGRYEVTAAHGRGVFSTVVRAKNLRAGGAEPEEVAVKIIRNNDTMYKAGMDELVILKKLVGADPDDKRHCVRFLSSFKYRNHLCLVFESLNMNLREVLKKFGRNIGLRLTAVRAYAKQLFIALKHLRNCGVLHCDIKPDNMLVNETKNVLKLCDFGNAMFAGKNEVTPYLVSRFYRAPEIILGLPYDHPLDMWSVGCCLYEIYTGKVLFPGTTNNDMLRLHMELKGPFPKKMLRKGAFTEQHFDQDLNFLATEEDPVTKRPIKRMIFNIRPKDIGTIITGSPGEDLKMLANFKDLLEKAFVLDPDKRLTVSQALNHPFITGK